MGMMQYDGDLLLPKTFLVPPPEINGVSGQYLAKNGISTFACSEARAFAFAFFLGFGGGGLLRLGASAGSASQRTASAPLLASLSDGQGSGGGPSDRSTASARQGAGAQGQCNGPPLPHGAPNGPLAPRLHPLAPPAAQTQQFGHVTFFWNGNRSGYFDSSLETYLEIPSDNVSSGCNASSGRLHPSCLGAHQGTQRTTVAFPNKPPSTSTTPAAHHLSQHTAPAHPPRTKTIDRSRSTRSRT